MTRRHFNTLLSQVAAVSVSPTSTEIACNISVDSGAVQHAIDPRIHGHFIEHISRVIHQGLWAELLRNRKFYPADPKRTQVADPWEPERDRSNISYAIDRNLSLTGISSQRVMLFGQSNAWRGISQSGFDVIAGREYVAYAWIYGKPLSQAVSFTLESHDGQVLTHRESTLKPADWCKYEARLRVPRDVRPAVFRIAFNSPGVNWIGAASLMPADHVEGMRRDVLETFRLLGPTIFRWPGGCYADAYDWRKAIGPRDRRPPVPIIPLGLPYGYDHGIDPNDFGTDEFLRLCQIMAAEPYINANFGTGTPEMAADWVEYVNGPATSKWGGVRAAHGHPAPYGVKLWAIGNEIYGDPYESGHTNAEGYATYYTPMVQAMRAVDPSLKTVAVGTLSDDGVEAEWNPDLVARVWEEIDYLSVHDYYPAGFWPPSLKGRPLAQYKAVVAEPTDVERRLRKTIELLDRITAGQKKIQIAFDEWNELDWDYPPLTGNPDRNAMVNYFVDLVGKSGLEFNQTHRDGLYTARMLHTFMRLGDRVPIAIRTHPINSIAAMRTDSTRVFMTATGKMMQLYRQHSGTRLLKAVAESPTFDVPEQGWAGVPYVDVVASLSADGRNLFVHLVNVHPNASISAHIEIKGRAPLSTGDMWQIAPSDFTSRNGFEVTNVDIQHSRLEHVTSNFSQPLPPHSATILQISLD